MKKPYRIALIASAIGVIFAVQTSSAQNLISNGNFSEPTGEGHTYSEGYLGAWRVTGPVVQHINSQYLAEVSDGSFLGGGGVVLGVYLQQGGIEQAFETKVGQEYELSFGLGSWSRINNGVSSQTQVTVAGVDSLFVAPPMIVTPNNQFTIHWDTISLRFQAVESTTRLSFAPVWQLDVAGQPLRQSNYQIVSAVSVVAVPEPGVLTLWAMSGLVAGWWMFRRRF